MTEVFFLDMEFHSSRDDRSTCARLLFTRGNNLRNLFFQPEVALQVERTDDQILIKNPGTWAALSIALESDRDLAEQRWDYFDCNHFHLFPGEQKTVKVWSSTPGVGRPSVSVKGWNTKNFYVQG